MDGVIQIYCGTELLADGTATGGRVTSLKINGHQMVQESQPLRAAALLFFDRLNASNAVEITIERQHTDLIASFDFAVTRRQTMAGVNDLTLIMTLAGATYTAVSQGCKWDQTQITPHGVGTHQVYPVTARTFSTSTTGAPLVQLLPTLTESTIDPLVIQSGRTGTVASGQLLVARSLQVDGNLILTGDLALIG